MPRKHIPYFLSFILCPPIATLVIGLLAFGRSAEARETLFSNFLFPCMALSLLAGVIGWAIFMRPPKHIADGMKAGALTVCLCYVLCCLVLSASMSVTEARWEFYLQLLFLSQLLTFWATYPIGLLIGRWIAKQLINKAPSNLSAFD